jgi:hypothetical protein
VKNIDLMIKDRRHSCNPSAAIRLGDITAIHPTTILSACLLAQFW